MVSSPDSLKGSRAEINTDLVGGEMVVVPSAPAGERIVRVVMDAIAARKGDE